MFLILISLAINVLPLTITDFWTSTYVYIIKQKPPQIAIFLYYLSWAQVSAVCFIDALIFMYRNRKIKDYLKAWRVGCSKPSLMARRDRTEPGQCQGNKEDNVQLGVTVANHIYVIAEDDMRI